MKATPEEMLTASDVAKILRVSDDWVYAEARAGRIPHKRFGKTDRTVRFDPEEFLEWLKSQTKGPVPLTGGAQ